MAKRTKAGKSSGKKAAPKTRGVYARRRAKLPQERVLPTLEDVTIEDLDNVCHSIAECRDTMAVARNDEKGLEQTALALMHRHKRTTYHGSGVELALVPGEEKLRVRTSKANATGSVQADDETGDDAASE